MSIQNAEIAALLSQEAELHEIQGANPFRVRTYRARGANDRRPARGIGQDLARKIAEIVKTGHFVALDDLKREVPGELPAIAALPGIGPKRVSRLHHQRTFDDLRRAVEGASSRLERLWRWH